MDTKLKNGNQDNEDKKRRGNGAKWTGIAIAFAAAALFTALMPEFHKKAQQYYETAGRVSMENEEFVSALIRGNYGLYKEVLDKSGSKTYSYEELYLEKELESDSGLDSNTPAVEQAEKKNSLLENAALKNASFLNAEQFQSVLEIYVNQMEEMAWEIQHSLLTDIEDSMDYYVLDKKTQTEIKNTTRPIENLLSAGNVEEKAHMEDMYEYYLIMDYDEAGNFQALGVKGQDADKLLKTLQATERSQYGYLLSGRKAQETYAFYYVGKDNVEKLLTLRQKKPMDAVFIYAMTKEQMNMIKNNGYAGGFPSTNDSSVPVSLIYSYAQAGIIRVWLLFLAVIFALVMFLALCMPRLLRGKRERKAPIEVIAAIAAFILFVVGGEVILAFVSSIENYGILEWLNENFPVTLSDGQEYEIIKNSVCFAFFVALFGAWYFVCLEFSDIVYGLKDYIRKRSLLYRMGAKICDVGKRIYRKYKAEVLDVDLGKDMNELLRKLLFISFCLLATACLCWYFGIIGVLVYVMALYYFLKKYIHKMQEQYALLLEATNAIAEGDFQNDFEEDFGIFESYKEELYKVQDGFKKAVEEEVKSQRMKTELITNVSHDLKTPLTAIITYTDLLKEENITDEQRKEYVNTLERKALRLKVLIEDLFEVSKTSSGSVNLEPVPVDICNLLRQVYLEYEDKMKQMGMHVRFDVPEEKIILNLDSQKTYRIFENLYVNILKYALPDTRVFIVAKKIVREKSRKDGIRIELKNISAQEIVGNPEDLSERFVRGDASRNTEGSGLGLAIAKNLTQLQGGKFMIETDGDLFKVVIEW
ncbi:MAG: HAMP domain-containing histidine kinase [Bacillus sp. (in: Bacteria)]|nr:HAMP domain-containing histidine kinase [Bacillus sp. (in: firmicutes)]MCM1427595.1 HAMP domain-containing histidine kinase [Eubacterium sp.]